MPPKVHCQNRRQASERPAATVPTEDLPLFQDTDPPSQRKSHQSISDPQEVAVSRPPDSQSESVPILDTPVSTDIDSLDFLTQPLQYLKGIGPRRAEMLENELGIQTVGELLAYYPRDYIDRSKMVEIYRVGRTDDDEPETIQGKVVNHTSSPTAKRETHR